VPYPPQFTATADPFVIWAAAAAVTSTIRLGSSTLNAPWYNAVLLARSLTTLDALSGGRLDVGFGASWLVAETQPGRPGEPSTSQRNLVRAGMAVRYERRNWCRRAHAPLASRSRAGR
jgi:alkanesulfonate monooxygenase SsuD/methylene tetrahydromethanopterin reductase-like flavin-dependent oxidoreductase (luciferase family)